MINRTQDITDLPDTEYTILAKMISNIGHNHSKLPETALTAFLAMSGKKYDRKLMVVGRALNGWGNEWLPKDVLVEDKVKEIVERMVGLRKDNHDQICWVSTDWNGSPNNKYKVRTSAFWRVIKKIVERLDLPNIIKPDWPSFLVWSNLYKISPGEGGNPSDKIKKLQCDYCRQLLALEVETYCPEKILFLTGYQWWAKPFMEGWTQDIQLTLKNEYKYIEAIGASVLPNSGRGKVVVAPHPQGKKETELVNEVVRAFA